MKRAVLCWLFALIALCLSQRAPAVSRDNDDDNDDDVDDDSREGMECEGNIHFELITGYVYSSSDDIIDSKNETHVGDCIKSCKADARCKAINFETGFCVFFQTSASENSAELLLSQLPVFTLYAQKICLTEETPTCQGAWAYESSPNIGIIENFAQDIREAEDRRDCALQCITETDFDCRSASYNFEDGTCTLATMDRFTGGPNRKYLQLRKSEVLIENYCKEIPRRMCDFKQVSGKILKTVDALYNTGVEDHERCRELCLKSTDFPCRSYDFTSIESESYCRLSHHSQATVSHIQDPYIEFVNATTYELRACFQVNVECRGDGMSATIRTLKLFDGTVYVKNRLESCSVDAENATVVKLDLPYNNAKCEVLQKEEGFFQANIVIQNRDIIVTADDVGLSLHCKYNLKNSTVTNKLPFIELKDGIQTEYIQETVVGSPNVTMTITTPEGSEVVSAQIGDKLALRFDIVTKKSIYEIFVRDLVAMGSKEEDKIRLIDDEGCPTSPSILGPITKIKKGKDLQTLFDAFKFPVGDVVHFTAVVSACMPHCEPIVCNKGTIDGFSYSSYGRRKRSIGQPEFLVAKSVKITDKFNFEGSLVDMSNKDSSNDSKMSLNSTCLSFMAVIVAVVLFILSQVVVLIVWRILWQSHRRNKQIDSSNSHSMLYGGSLSSRQSSLRGLSS